MNFPKLDSPAITHSDAIMPSSESDYNTAANQDLYDYMLLQYCSSPLDSFPGATFDPGVSAGLDASFAHLLPESGKYGMSKGSEVGAGYSASTTSFPLVQQTDIFSMADSFPAPVFGQQGFFSNYNACDPSTSMHFQPPTTVSPRDIQLSILPNANGLAPENNISPFTSHYDFTSPYSTSSSPVTPIKAEASPPRNALQLFTSSQDVSTQPSLQFQSAPDLDFSMQMNSQLFFGNCLPSPSDSCRDFNGHDHINPSPVNSCGSIPHTPSTVEIAFDECSRRISSCFPSTPEHQYPSPSPTPERAAIPLPVASRSSSKLRTAASRPRTHRPIRAVASRRKSYREPSASPTPSSFKPSIFDSVDSPFSTTDFDSTHNGKDGDECKFGKQVWALDRKGRRAAKWECCNCGVVVGRRPDLHRHWKTCFKREKFYCLNVIHGDGSIWAGCGMEFSRRDACHRHLKKRFSEGRCSKTRPKQAMCSSPEDYEEKIANHRDMLEKSKWRASLPASEKNRLVKTALSHIKQDIF
ncbi:hypothetical protein DFH11DRAFT_306015 [Phellopilus nigrolimitatus]|nr:hypothetical protein DFH11DRAFT_306015 [Phellopilus nigrolimitatus]